VVFVAVGNLVLANGIASISAMVFWWIAARFYSVSEIGLASSLISATSLIVFLSSYGFTSSFLRFLPQAENRNQLLVSLTLVSVAFLLLLCGVFYLFVLLVPANLSFMNGAGYFAGFVVLSLSMLLFQILTPILTSYDLTKAVLVKNTVQGIMRIVFLAFVLGHGGFAIYSTNGLSAACSVVCVLLAAKPLRTALCARLTFCFGAVSRIFSFSSVNFINVLHMNIPGLLFPVILVTLYRQEDAGYFYIPWMMFSLYASIEGAILSVLLAQAARKEDYRSLAMRAGVAVGLLSVFGPLLCTAFGEDLLLFFRKEFAEHSLSTLRILFLSFPLFALVQFVLCMKNIQRRLRDHAMISGTGVVSLVAMLVVLMPRLGPQAIGYAWGISNAAGCLVIAAQYMVRRRRLQRKAQA